MRRYAVTSSGSAIGRPPVEQFMVDGNSLTRHLGDAKTGSSGRRLGAGSASGRIGGALPGAVKVPGLAGNEEVGYLDSRARMASARAAG